MPYRGIWRDPAEESMDLYPGLVVHDNRQTGSITAGRSRLPVWAFCTTAILGQWSEGGKQYSGWGSVEGSYNPEEYGLTEEDFANFIYCLMELRGEFGRLLLVLADMERRERHWRSWWQTKVNRGRMRRQLRRCLAVLDALEA